MLDSRVCLKGRGKTDLIRFLSHDPSGRKKKIITDLGLKPQAISLCRSAA